MGNPMKIMKASRWPRRNVPVPEKMGTSEKVVQFFEEIANPIRDATRLYSPVLGSMYC
jgi:hypothetical protein